MHHRSHNQGGLCPGGSLSRASQSKWVSVQGGLCHPTGMHSCLKSVIEKSLPLQSFIRTGNPKYKDSQPKCNFLKHSNGGNCLSFPQKLGFTLSQASEDYVEDTSVYGAAEMEGLLPEWLNTSNQMIVHLMETNSGM